MGLLASLGRMWNGSAGREGRPEARRVAPVAIDLHTRSEPEPDVAVIDRELTDRLGMEPSPLPGRGRDGAAPAVPGASAAAQTLATALLALPERTEPRGRMRSKQQVLDQLRENYEEVIRVVRKVDGQLDQQHRRGERMLEIAEGVSPRLDRLPEIRDETRKVADAIERLAAGVDRGNDRLDRTMSEQVAAIERVQRLLGQLVEADHSLGESIDEFRRTAAGMTGATERLGSVLGNMQDRASRRDAQIVEALDRSQKTLVTALVLSLASAAAAITLVVLALL